MANEKEVGIHPCFKNNGTVKAVYSKTKHIHTVLTHMLAGKGYDKTIYYLIVEKQNGEVVMVKSEKNYSVGDSLP